MRNYNYVMQTAQSAHTQTNTQGDRHTDRGKRTHTRTHVILISI